MQRLGLIVSETVRLSAQTTYNLCFSLCIALLILSNFFRKQYNKSVANIKQFRQKLFDTRYVNYDKMVAFVYLRHVLPVAGGCVPRGYRSTPVEERVSSKGGGVISGYRATAYYTENNDSSVVCVSDYFCWCCWSGDSVVLMIWMICCGCWLTTAPTWTRVIRSSGRRYTPPPRADTSNYANISANGLSVSDCLVVFNSPITIATQKYI